MDNPFEAAGIGGLHDLIAYAPVFHDGPMVRSPKVLPFFKLCHCEIQLRPLIVKTGQYPEAGAVLIRTLPI